MQRRRFVQLASLTTASLPFWGLAKTTSPDMTPAGEDDLYNLFVQPTSNYQPFVRWWWNGDRVTKKEVLRELDVMKAAGIGGVEINPIKWNSNAEEAGFKELTWGSTEWLEVVYAALNGAKERGITCDMIVGSGWPYGGEFVPREEQCQMIALGTKDLEGRKTVSISKKELIDSVNPPFAFGYHDSVKELFMLRLANGQMNEFEKGTDLNGLLQDETISFNVPDGKHVLYYLVKITGFAAVIQGALGASGPVINHYDKTAVSNYLNGFGNKLTSRLGRLDNYFRSFFTDSIELEGANWCSDMFEEFKRRRGYDLVPYFPYILFKTGEMGNAVKEEYGSKFSASVKDTLNRVRYDFEITKHDLFHERFIQTFVDWCRQHGVKSRMQAYGMDCDPIDATMMIDIPECETWIWRPEIEEFGKNSAGRNYTMINKFVTSAAHFSGKQLISCEEMTSTEQIFNVTLERVKVTGDQSNLSGVTHSVLHGFNYSPMEAPFPGWIRYGSFFNERNTWWPYFRLWSDYKTRLSCVLQNSVMQADIAVLHPLADLASRHGFQRDPFPQVVYPAYVHNVWEAIHQNGNGCDYVSEHILQQSSVNNGKFTFNQRTYNALILIETETMQPATAEVLEKFADEGGKIIFIAKTPHISSGLLRSLEDGKRIAAISKSILTTHPTTTGVVPAPGDDMVSWYGDIQRKFSLTPYVQINKPVYHVSQLYYKNETQDILYLVNYSAEHEHSFTMHFQRNKTPWLWNAETGERQIYPQNTKGELEIHLGASETKLIVFDNKKDGEKYKREDVSGLKPKVLTNQWQLELLHVNGTRSELTLDTLVDLRQKDALKDFAGSITYKATITLDANSKAVYLDLGKLNDVTEVTINGKPAGVRWYGRHLYNISSFVKAGENAVSIKLTTILGHYTKSLKDNKAAQEWSGAEVKTPIGLVGQVRLLVG